MSGNKGKHGNNNNIQPDNQKDVARLPSNIRIVPPEPLIVQLRSSTEENHQYSEEKNYRDRALATAQRLNRITVVGMGVGLCSIFFLWAQVRTAQTANNLLKSQFITDQRPYVLIISGDMLNSGDPRIMVNAYPANYGKSPALQLLSKGTVLYGPEAGKKGDEFFKSLGNERFTRSEFGSAITLPPLNGANPRTGQWTTYTTDTIVGSEDRKWIQEHEFGFYIVARIQYHDMSGKFYQTDYCGRRLISGAIAECTTHNDVQ